jgi:uncharacterized SAM-binding protein YcdF (DUF218 family)
MRVALLVSVLLLGAAVLAVPRIGRLLVVADPLPAHADAIVVMAGSVSDRALEAADLYHAGVAPRIVVTREARARGAFALAQRGVHLPEGHERTRQALAGLGVPPDAVVVLRRRAWSTSSEARTIARWACRQGLRRLVVVTSRSHTRRARLILRQALGPGRSVAMRPARADGFPARRWWQRHAARKLVLSEYEKLAHYWLRERWQIAPCGGLARRR